MAGWPANHNIAELHTDDDVRSRRPYLYYRSSSLERGGQHDVGSRANSWSQNGKTGCMRHTYVHTCMHACFTRHTGRAILCAYAYFMYSRSHNGKTSCTVRTRAHMNFRQYFGSGKHGVLASIGGTHITSLAVPNLLARVEMGPSIHSFDRSNHPHIARAQKSPS